MTLSVIPGPLALGDLGEFERGALSAHLDAEHGRSLLRNPARSKARIERRGKAVKISVDVYAGQNPDGARGLEALDLHITAVHAGDIDSD